MKYQKKKPVAVDARQVTSENVLDIAHWCGGGARLVGTDGAYVLGGALAGWRAYIGWWVVFEEHKGFSRHTPEDFAATYEPLPDSASGTGEGR